MQLQRILSIASCISIAISACNSEKNAPVTARKDIITQNIDTTADPSEDFFQYAMGTWLKNLEIPADETHWGIGNMVDEELQKRLLHINEEAVANPSKSKESEMLANFWSSGMDTLTIEKSGIAPIKVLLNQIEALQNSTELLQCIAGLHSKGISVFFSAGVGQDEMNSEQMAFYMMQGGLGLPNREYYFNTDARTTEIRNAYPAYITKVFQLAGNSEADAQNKARNIVALEIRLAGSSRKLQDLRDPYRNYNKFAINQLSDKFPGIDWPQLLADMGVKQVDSVIAGQPEFLKEMVRILSKEPLQHIKDYLTFNVVRTMSPYLSSDFVNAHFDFYSRKIRGAREMRKRWKRVLDTEENAMGEILGKLFVKEYFNETAKKRYEVIVENVRKAYEARIKKLDWMSDTTKQKAIVKLNAITPKIGFPDQWKDLSALKTVKGNYVENVLLANAFWNSYELNKLGKPVDRKEWNMTPQTYNAYYNPSNNEIVMPAGIFTVPGYLDSELDDALVYGYAAASTVGHEITHGFDDQGRQYDEKGNLNNWWTKKDEAEFNKRAALLVQQFDGFVVVDSLHINGEATLGENLADLGGILIGLDAFKNTETYKKGEAIHGFTPLQRFFMGYALGWMYAIRKEQLAAQILTDVHSPAKYRVNGAFPNVPEFYEAFNIRPGSKMYLPDSLRVKLW